MRLSVIFVLQSVQDLHAFKRRAFERFGAEGLECFVYSQFTIHNSQITIYLRPCDTVDELDERREGRIVATVAISIENQVSYILMTVEFQHTAEMGVFLRAAAHFHIPLACRQ